jgi:isoleucyl-tRNA synthetase
VNELGGFYLDIIKDRQYTCKTESLARRSAQTALYHIVEAFVRWIAPILSFTADELWPFIPGKEISGKRTDSVFVAEWYEGLQTLAADSVFGEIFWQRVMAVKTAVNRVLEVQRKEGLIGGTLEAEITLYCDDELAQQLQRLGDELRFVLIASSVKVAPLAAAANAIDSEIGGLKIAIAKTASAKCVRCWHHTPDIGVNANHPELCGRCVENVDGAGEIRRYA